MKEIVNWGTLRSGEPSTVLEGEFLTHWDGGRVKEMLQRQHSGDLGYLPVIECLLEDWMKNRFLTEGRNLFRIGGRDY